MSDSSSSSAKRPLPSSPSTATAESQVKKAKTDEQPAAPRKSLLPPSTFLHRAPGPGQDVARPPIETDVGILEYVGRDIEPFQGIIKQRFTDFMVYEIGLDDKTVHLLDIGQPTEPILPEAPPPPPAPKGTVDLEALIASAAELTTEDPFEANDLWPQTTTRILLPLLGLDKTRALRDLLIEGREPPLVPDAGWGKKRLTEEEKRAREEEDEMAAMAAGPEKKESAREREEREREEREEEERLRVERRRLRDEEAAAAAASSAPASASAAASSGSARVSGASASAGSASARASASATPAGTSGAGKQVAVGSGALAGLVGLVALLL